MKNLSRSARGRQAVAPLKELGKISDPLLEELREETAFILNERDSNVFARARLNYEARYCVWAGQSEDGRKWTPRSGEDEVFPWSGASDARVPLVDLYVKKHHAFLMTLYDRMRTRVNGTEVNDLAWANRMTSFLRWMKYTQMTEARRENELLANYLLERGSGVMGIFWSKQRQLAYEELDLETLVTQAFEKAQAAQNPEEEQAWLDLPQATFNPAFDAETAKLLVQLYPDVPAGALARILPDLRAQGFARFPRPIITINRPKIVALAPNEDVFISPDARYEDDGTILWFETMREAKFRARAKDLKWDPAWADEVLETQRGNVEFGSMEFRHRLTPNTASIVPWKGSTNARKLFLVGHAYRRLADANGVPGIFYTCFHPHLTERCARHELMNYDHGQQPFVWLTSETRSRRVDDARGYGEVAHTWQNQVKAVWDNRIDRESIATVPPSHYPPGQQPDKWGPGVQVPTTSPEQYGFYDPPRHDPGSEEVEISVRGFSDDYFGFTTTEDKAADAAVMKQQLANRWLDAQTRIDVQILQLCQQFEPDEIYFREVGSAKGNPIHATREDIQGKFDLQCSFDTGDLDPEQRQQKAAMLNDIVASDVNGILDHNEALMVRLEMYDPNLGERLLKPAESASQQEKDDEESVFGKLLIGISVPVKPGQAYQLRLQTLQSLLQTNQMAQNLVPQNEQAQEAIKQRLKDLTQALQNAPGGPNAQIGRGGPNFAPKLTEK